VLVPWVERLLGSRRGATTKTSNAATVFCCCVGGIRRPSPSLRRHGQSPQKTRFSVRVLLSLGSIGEMDEFLQREDDECVVVIPFGHKPASASASAAQHINTCGLWGSPYQSALALLPVFIKSSMAKR
jgi:hypothetical protein